MEAEDDRSDTSCYREDLLLQWKGKQLKEIRSFWVVSYDSHIIILIFASLCFQ